MRASGGYVHVRRAVIMTSVAEHWSSAHLQVARPQRFSPKAGHEIRIYADDRQLSFLGTVEQISSTGVAFVCSERARALARGARVGRVMLRSGKSRLRIGSAVVARTFEVDKGGAKRPSAALAFETEQATIIEALIQNLESPRY